MRTTPATPAAPPTTAATIVVVTTALPDAGCGAAPTPAGGGPLGDGEAVAVAVDDCDSVMTAGGCVREADADIDAETSAEVVAAVVGAAVSVAEANGVGAGESAAVGAAGCEGELEAVGTEVGVGADEPDAVGAAELAMEPDGDTPAAAVPDTVAVHVLVVTGIDAGVDVDGAVAFEAADEAVPAIVLVPAPDGVTVELDVAAGVCVAGVAVAVGVADAVAFASTHGQKR